jgi:hypothetical protein
MIADTTNTLQKSNKVQSTIGMMTSRDTCDLGDNLILGDTMAVILE